MSAKGNSLIGDRDGLPAPPLAQSTAEHDNVAEPHAPLQNLSLANAEEPQPAPESARQEDPVLPASSEDVILPAICEQAHMSDNLGNKYDYSSLLPGDIRLLHLLPHEVEKAPIRCQLVPYSLQKTGERACSYEALSYSWGSGDKPYFIYIGERRLRVTKNLYAALLRLRDRFIGRIIWVDAICINQCNDPEKNLEKSEQIQLMAEIYSKASRVVVWLGETENGGDQALEEIRLTVGKGLPRPLDNGLPKHRISALLQRPWFRRIWVLQEVAAARQILIKCGSAEIDGYAFCVALDSESFNGFYRADPTLQTQIRPATYLIKRAVFLRKVPKSSDRFSLHIHSLSELIDMYHTHEATWRPDKVFALLGMSSDNLATADLRYTDDWEKLLAKLVTFILGVQVSVDARLNREMAIIEGKGCILGKVSGIGGDRDGRQQMIVKLKDTSGHLGPEREWALHASAKAVLPGDFVCFMQGAKKPTIVRLCKDYFAIVVIAVPLNGEQEPSAYPHDFLLVWDWESFQNDSQDREEYESAIEIRAGEHADKEGGDYLAKASCQKDTQDLEEHESDKHADKKMGGNLAKAIRLWNAAAILQDAEQHEAAEWRFREVDENGLSDVYGHMIEKRQMPDLEHCKNVLMATCLAYRPLSLSELAIVAGLPPNINPKTIVEKCSSFLTTKDGTIRLRRQSAKDYLEKNFQPANVVQGHADISRRSIDAMSRLEQNIYSLEFGYRPEDMTPPDPDPLAPLSYSCVFWADHLLNGEMDKRKRALLDDRAVFAFLKDHLLRWLESLSLLGKLADGIKSIRMLLHVAQLQPGVSPQLVEFLKDAEKFILRHTSIIKRAPLQTYGSALVFIPTMSEAKNAQWKEKLPFIKMATVVGDRWAAHWQTLGGHNEKISAVAFSPDGKVLASGSMDATVRLWDAATGTHRQTLVGHTNSVKAIAFSPDGKTLASASNDCTVRLWDMATSTHRQTLVGHCSLRAVAFSPDGKTLATTACDKTVWLWDAATGTHRQTLKKHNDEVVAVAFSLDGKTLASASLDRTVRLWNAVTGAYQRTLKGHSNAITAIAFSPESRTLVSASRDMTVRLWNVATGTYRLMFEEEHFITAIAFSLDGKVLALGAPNGLNRWWDSGSKDYTIWLWDTATGAYRQTLKGPVASRKGVIPSIAFSPDGMTLASASHDKVWLCDMATGTHWQTKGHSDYVLAVAFSPDGMMLASASHDKTVRLWDAATGTHWRTLEGHTYPVIAVAISPDSKILASASRRDWDPPGIQPDHTIWLWDTAAGTHRQTLKGPADQTHALTFSADGKTLVSTNNNGIHLWDAATGIYQRGLTTNPNITRLVFLEDGRYLKTNDGLLKLSSKPTSSQKQEDALFVKGEWVTLDGKEYIWLPEDYRATCSAVYGRTAVLGHRSGGLTFLQFSDKLLSD